MNVLNSSTASILAGAMLAATLQPASAATASRTLWDQGGPACQLSVPTISSLVRPRATGMRNEGTTSQFIICQYASTSDAFTAAAIYFSTIDGANHNVQCTGMSGTSAGGAALYSTKNGATGTNPASYSGIAWSPADFGGTTNFGNSLFSVTCILPAGASIIVTEANYDENIGT
jgi:hypothetical protein